MREYLQRLWDAIRGRKRVVEVLRAPGSLPAGSIHAEDALIRWAERRRIGQEAE